MKAVDSEPIFCDECHAAVRLQRRPDGELYPTVVPMVGAFDMPLCEPCARLGTGDGDVEG